MSRRRCSPGATPVTWSPEHEQVKGRSQKGLKSGMKGKDRVGSGRGVIFCVSALPTRQPGKRRADYTQNFGCYTNRIKGKERIIRGNDGNLFFSSEIIDPH